MGVLGFIVSFLGLLLCVRLVHGYTPYHAAELHSKILSNYSSKVRPSAQTNVGLTFGMMHMTELNIVTQTLHCVGFLVVKVIKKYVLMMKNNTSKCIALPVLPNNEMADEQSIQYWYDGRLTWNPANHDNMTEVFIPLSDIWSPLIVLNNAADAIKVINDDNDLSSLNAYVEFDGNLLWLAPANFLAQCSINIKYYPFDSQECDIVVSSWMYLEEHVSIISHESSINLDIYENHGEWDLTSSSVTNITRLLSGHRLPAVQFTLHLSRKYSYYLLNMLLPVIILAMMGPFVFLLPAASGEKIGFALTILLSLSVVMTLVSDNIPPTSNHTCILSVYLLMTFIICSLETILTVWTCKIHDICGKHFKMGKTMTKFTSFLATVTGYGRHREPYSLSCNDTPTTNCVSKVEYYDSEETVNHKEQTPHKQNTRKLNNDMTQYSPEELIRCFDRFNFWLFMVLTITVTVVIMIILQIGGQS